MFQVSNMPNVPAQVQGTGTADQLFAPKLIAPGSGRLDGQSFELHLAGSVTPATASTVQLKVWANYPNLSTGSNAPQYPQASITSAVVAGNIATYNAQNNFVVGQYVTVANMANTNLNGTVGPILSANANAFTASNVNGAALNFAALANAAQTATATIAPIAVYTANVSPSLAANVTIPFMCDLKAHGDSGSGIITFYGTDETVNVNASANGTPAIVPNVSTGTVVPLPGVNFKNEPPVYFTVSEAFGSSNVNNSAKLTMGYLES